MFFKWIEHLPSKEAVIGSNPIGLTSTLRIATRGFCLLAPTPIGLAKNQFAALMLLKRFIKYIILYHLIQISTNFGRHLADIIY